MSSDHPLNNDPFSYLSTENGLVEIAYQGETVTVLSGTKAARFIARVGLADPTGEQLEMAEVTGHFKRGAKRARKLHCNG